MEAQAKVLVIDDDEIVRLSHLRVLASTPYDVETAQDGKQALSVMEQHPVDVVLLDLRMPGMDGLSVLKEIKARWPEIEVVIITGYASVDTAKEAIQLGAFDYLAKPVFPDEIIKVANGAMTQKKWALHKAAPGIQ
jgi:DNA-binding NtrC family response regulator